jgi:glycosyltransferase 2 family protein
MRLQRFIPLIGIILFMYILSTLDVSNMIRIFSTISPLYLILSFFSILPIILFTNIAWQVLLKKQQIRISYFESLKNILIGYFYGFITPGGFGGYLRTIYLQKKSDTPIQQCITNVVLFNVIDYITLLILAIIGTFFFAIQSSTFYSLFFVLILLICLVNFSIYFILYRRKTLHKIVHWLFSLKFFNPFSKASDNFELFYKNLPSIKKLIVPIFLSIFGWIIRFFIFYLIAFLFNINISFIYFIFIVAIGNIIGSIPITIYGLGTREITLLSLFSFFSISKELVISMSLFWFVLIWLIPSILGLFVVLKEDLPRYKSDNELKNL